MRLPWYKRKHQRTLERDRPLPLEQRGALGTIEDLIMMRGAPLPDDVRWLAGHLGCSVRKAGQILAALVGAGVLFRAGDGFMTESCAELIAERHGESERNAAAGQASGAARRAKSELSPENPEIIPGSADAPQAKSRSCGNGRSEELERENKQAAAVTIPAAAPRSKSRAEDPVLTQQAVELHRAVAKLIGSEAGRWAHEFGTVMGWVERGWGGHALSAIERVLKRRKGQLPNSWKYFTDAIGESAKGTGPPPAPSAAVTAEMSDAEWDRAVAQYCKFARKAKHKGLTGPPAFAWHHQLGPPPGDERCRAPAAVLERHGFTRAA